MTYAKPLKERIDHANYMHRRYWREPEFRLRAINTARVWRGAEPYQSVEQIRTRGPYRG